MKSWFENKARRSFWSVHVDALRRSGVSRTEYCRRTVEKHLDNGAGSRSDPTRAQASHASHCGLRSSDLGTNKLSTGDLTVDGCAVDTRGEGACSAGGWSPGLPFDAGADGCGPDGNSALDQPRSRSSAAETAAGKGSSKRDVVSDAVSRNSMVVSFGMSKSGSSPLATDAATASANLTSGCRH
jgi:hypothetical protein